MYNPITSTARYPQVGPTLSIILKSSTTYPRPRISACSPASTSVSSEYLFANANDKNKNIENASSQGVNGTSAATAPAIIRCVYNPASKTTSTNSLDLK